MDYRHCRPVRRWIRGGRGAGPGDWSGESGRGYQDADENQGRATVVSGGGDAGGVQGIVRVEITVGISGHVEAARVISSVPLLDQAALDTVKHWEFTPPLVNSVPTPVIVTPEVSFALGGGNRALRGNLDASLLPDADVRRQPFLIAPGRVGLLQVGMTVDKLLQLIPSAQTSLIDMRFEGHFTPAIAVRLDALSPQPSLIAAYRQLLAGRVEEWRVAAIEIMDPRFRTAEGLGVGSTIAEIRAMHPNMEPTLGTAGPLVSMHDRAIWFWLDPTAVRGSRVPDTATVIRISVRGGASANRLSRR
jgi:TonB family protein